MNPYERERRIAELEALVRTLRELEAMAESLGVLEPEGFTAEDIRLLRDMKIGIGGAE